MRFTAEYLEGGTVLRARSLIALASIAGAAACGDQSVPTAPTRPNAITTSQASTPYAVTVDTAVTLEGFPGSDYNIAYGVNALGDVAGVSISGGALHAVRWPAGSTVLQDVAIGEPHDINTSGQLAGEVSGQAALWNPDGAGGYKLTEIGGQLPSAISSTAYAINANGQVVGTYRIVSPDGTIADKCFLWTPDLPNASTGTATALPDLGGSFCVANDVNSAGVVVGAAMTTAGETHAFVWAPSVNGRLPKIRDLTPANGPSYATSINDGGQIAGQHTAPSVATAAIWTPTGAGSYVMTELGTFTGTESFALDINDAGFVVGYARRSDLAEDDAFLWQNGEFTLLPGLASINEPTALTALSGDSVQVVGASYDGATGARTAVRWNITVTQARSTPK